MKKPIVVKYPVERLDKNTKIKKASFIINCENCSIFQKMNRFQQCKDEGCKFDNFYKSLNSQLTLTQKMRIVKIHMDSYYKLI